MNTRYPGKPDYTGPTKGLFTLLHHEGPLLEWSDDVMKRVKYINEQKPEYERAIRLRHIVFFPEKLRGKKMWKADAEWKKAYAERQKADAEWKKADADKILTYLKKHVKDCKWDGSTLVFKERRHHAPRT